MDMTEFQVSALISVVNQEIEDAEIDQLRATAKANGGEFLDFRDEPDSDEDLPETF
jgi:hypothetical protein